MQLIIKVIVVHFKILRFWDIVIKNKRIDNIIVDVEVDFFRSDEFPIIFLDLDAQSLLNIFEFDEKSEEKYHKDQRRDDVYSY